MKKDNYRGAKVVLADGRGGDIIIPGLDACLIETEDGERIWAITEWEYKRRIENINKGIPFGISDDNPSKKEKSKSKNTPKKSPYEQWLPKYMETTRIIEITR